MYFDAVQEILKKLADTNLKTSVKARLERDLKELDPNGIIRKFVEEGGERPDISDLIGTTKKKSSSQPLRKPGNKTPEKKSKTSTSKNEEEEEEEENVGNQEKKPVSKKSSPSVNKESNSLDESNNRVLMELSESLEDVISIRDRKRLVDYLKSRLESISEPKKRASAYAKIAERLGDIDYWTDYYENKVKAS